MLGRVHPSHSDRLTEQQLHPLNQYPFQPCGAVSETIVPQRFAPRRRLVLSLQDSFFDVTTTIREYRTA